MSAEPEQGATPVAPSAAAAASPETRGRGRGFARPRARVLLATLSLVAALLLTGSALAGFFAARLDAEVLGEVQLRELARSVALELARSEQPEAALSFALEELENAGLRAVVLVVPGRGTLAEAGEPAEGDPPPTLAALRPRPGALGARLEKLPSGRWRLALRLPPPRGFRGRERFEAPPDAPLPSEPEGRGPAWRAFRGRGSPGVLLVEAEPLEARALVRRAERVLVVNLGAATLLIVLSAFAWRAAKRSDEAEAAIARDRPIKALGQMSAVLGHQLRNPLASLKGHAQLLAERLQEGAPGHQSARIVVEESERLERLVEDVLEFARTGQLRLAPCDPAALGRRVLERAGLPSAWLELGPGAPASVVVDEARLEQALVNVVHNAMEVSERGEPLTLTLGARGESFFFALRDRGPGLPEGDPAELFEPFVTTRAKGTGLGLALARRIVESHGGSIRAENAPGGGALFTLELPLEAALGTER